MQTNSDKVDQCLHGGEGEGRVGRKEFRRGMRRLLGVMEMFVILIVTMGSWIYKYVNIYQIIFSKYVQLL